jgi:ribosomal protein L24
MKKNKRLFPITEEVFNRKILPVIEGNYIWKGHPPKVSHYRAFCGILYILRPGTVAGFTRCIRPLARDIRAVFTGKQAGAVGKVLSVFQKEKGVADAEVIIDSTTMKVHRRGGGQKGGQQSKETSRSGITTKFHAAITGDVRLAEGFLGGGQVADVTVAARLTGDVIGCTVLANCGYDSDAFRRELRGNNNIPVSPCESNIGIFHCNIVVAKIVSSKHCRTVCGTGYRNSRTVSTPTRYSALWKTTDIKLHPIQRDIVIGNQHADTQRFV